MKPDHVVELPWPQIATKSGEAAQHQHASRPKVHSFIPLSLTPKNSLLELTHIYSYVDILSVVSKSPR